MRLPSRDEYLSAEPFPHCVIDGFISPELVREINSQWPSHFSGIKKKEAIKQHTQQLPEAASRLADYMNSRIMCERLAKMAGIPILLPDNGLNGGGLHSIPRGGHLGIHVDFNKLGDLYRRMNVLIYLNEDWKWGGDLELWDDKCVKSISPIAGRAVIFSTSETSWHGHPTPLDCPPDRQRRSIAFYYYSTQPPKGCGKRHSTIYRDRL